jgi:hypothetical protein
MKGPRFNPQHCQKKKKERKEKYLGTLWAGVELRGSTVECEALGFQPQRLLHKWPIPGLDLGKTDKMTPEYCVVPESKELFRG